MSQDSARITELNAKLTAYGSKAPGSGADSQTQLDAAHALRVAKDEIKDKHGT
jgi:hypothetical protein